MQGCSTRWVRLLNALSNPHSQRKKSECRIIGCAGERNDVANVLHTCHKQEQTFESEPESGVWTSTVTTRVKIPPEFLCRHLQLVDARHQLVVTLFAHGASDDLAYLGEEDVGSLHRLAVRILLHIESLDVLPQISLLQFYQLLLL